MLDSTTAAPSVAILMCTYNGEQYLDEQLLSFETQSYPNWKLYVSDDGSKDGTIALLKDYQSKWQAKWGENRLVIINGPRLGFSFNFLSLTCNPDIVADYYAWSDQDDIWLVDKITRAISQLQSKDQQRTQLYCTRTQLIDNQKTDIGLSPLFEKLPSFHNALVQSIAGGNTMVFNQTLKNDLMIAGPEVKVVTHDWWLYIVATGCGGEVIYDPQPSLLYRQHDNNLIGSNNSLSARLKRIRMLFEGHFQEWNDQNTAALQRLKDHLTTESATVLSQFQHARHAWFLLRLYLLSRVGLYRQTTLGNLGLIVAAIFKRI
ncbi:glycosyltransferase family 2 protein [Aquirhabdus sp.]|uniref:glycosyltransferase family 2 protein n=1 Tax=Aquirhabdus sp. TaxID=2824160 RepID=UPI00396CC396